MKFNKSEKIAFPLFFVLNMFLAFAWTACVVNIYRNTIDSVKIAVMISISFGGILLFTAFFSVMRRFPGVLKIILAGTIWMLGIAAMMLSENAILFFLFIDLGLCLYCALLATVSGSDWIKILKLLTSGGKVNLVTLFLNRNNENYFDEQEDSDMLFRSNYSSDAERCRCDENWAADLMEQPSEDVACEKSAADPADIKTETESVEPEYGSSHYESFEEHDLEDCGIEHTAEEKEYEEKLKDYSRNKKTSTDKAWKGRQKKDELFGV